jgi:hypothetical protein
VLERRSGDKHAAFGRWNERVEHAVDGIDSGRYALLYFPNEGFPEPHGVSPRGTPAYSIEEQLRNRLARLRDIQERVAVAEDRITEPATVRCVAVRQRLLDATQTTQDLIAEHPFPAGPRTNGHADRFEEFARAALKGPEADRFLSTEGLVTGYPEGPEYERIHHHHLRSLRMQTRLATDCSPVREDFDPDSWRGDL